MERPSTLQSDSPSRVQPAARAAAAALLWHFEDDDVKNENIALRQAVQDVTAQLAKLQQQHAALEMQRESEIASLRVVQESLRYERRINVELEGMHRLATENLRKLRDEVRGVYEEDTFSAARAMQVRMEGALHSMGWKKEERETLDKTVRPAVMLIQAKLQRALLQSSANLQELEQQNKDLKTYVTLLEFIWTQPLDCSLATPQDVTMDPQADSAGTSQSTDIDNLLKNWQTAGAGPFDTSLLSF